jgi:hypothetical protein
VKAIVKDNKGRVLLVLSDNGRLAVARYEDMDEAFKQYIINYYKDMTIEPQEKIDKLVRFLNFEEDTDEFCS